MIQIFGQEMIDTAFTLIRYVKYFLIGLFHFLVVSGQAQVTDSISATYQLNDVIISASKLPKHVDQLPKAIFQVDSFLVGVEKQNLSIKEYLQAVPGVYVQNAYNFTQDTRISIRGFGATAAFGIRGIKLLVDGIPETTPDGTGQLDNLNLDLINRIQIIRGSASSLFGNASGGAILIQSKFDFEKDFFESSSSVGSYGFYSQAFSGGVKLDSTTITGHVRLFGSEGFRDHSKFRQINT